VAPEALYLATSDSVVLVEEGPPCPVPQLGSAPGRTDDVREKKGCEETVIQVGRASCTGEEGFQLAERALDVVEPGQEPGPRALHVPRPRDVLGSRQIEATIRNRLAENAGRGAAAVRAEVK